MEVAGLVEGVVVMVAEDLVVVLVVAGLEGVGKAMVVVDSAVGMVVVG